LHGQQAKIALREEARVHGEILVLDDATIKQIAAGEVIERPVSVVKELVENSLDAGARRVTVELTDGGRESIIVIDDGAGISPTSLPLAFARHATSKLRGVDDLLAIRSLGFRGEGLASIAAAAAVELISRRETEPIGQRITANAKGVGTAVAIAAPLGTKVSVHDLFAATPARRQFLKSGRAEFTRVAALLTQLAVGWPSVGFTLRHDGREVWSLPPARDPVDRLETVFGKSARGALASITADEHARVRVAGHTNRAGHDRPNRSSQVFFVNGRLVRSPALSAAWLAGYGSSGMTGRYPFGVLVLTLPPEDVDVNVQPTKIEVRFADARGVFDAVRNAVAHTVRRDAMAETVGAVSFAPAASAPMEHAQIASGEGDRAPILFDADLRNGRLQVYGQIDRAYIVAIDAREICVVDQHAAHERVAYEAILERSSAPEPGAPLLFPEVVSLTPSQAATLEEYGVDLAQAGVDVEPFGDGSYRVNSVPSGYFGKGFELGAMLDELAADDAPREGIGRRNRVIATIACHSVVRAGDPLSLQEQRTLIDRLQRCRDPQTCPHGRPTMLRLDAATFEKAFKRA
jgi:DNA mismatch repair protein MutL